MSDPLTDYRRAASYHHAGSDPADQWRTAVHQVRTILAFLLGTASALVLASATVLALGAVHVLSPERPARAVPLLLSVPEVRTEVAEDWATELATDVGATFTDAERDELVGVLDDVLASPRLHQQLRDLRPVDGRLDGTELVAVLADEVRARAAGRSSEVRRVLDASAGLMPRQLAEEGSSADASGPLDTIRDLRRYALLAAGVMALPGLFLAALAVAVARRRPLTAVLISSGGLLLTVLALAPGRFVLERLPGPLSIPGHVLAAIGELLGPGTVWALLLAAAVPPAVWWALGSLRASANAAPTS